MVSYLYISLCIGILSAIGLSHDFLTAPQEDAWLKRHWYPIWFVSITTLCAILWPILLATCIYMWIDEW